MKQERWLKQWAVPSDSGGGDYIISLTVGNPNNLNADGNKYACSCPGWTRNVAKFCPTCGTRLGKEKEAYCWTCRKAVIPRTERLECKHIGRVRVGLGTDMERAVMNRIMGR